jgi:hypothetical protein
MKKLILTLVLLFAACPSVVKADGCESPLDCPDDLLPPLSCQALGTCPNTDPPVQVDSPLELPVSHPDKCMDCDDKEPPAQPDNPLNIIPIPPPEPVFYVDGLGML